MDSKPDISHVIGDKIRKQSKATRQSRSWHSIDVHANQITQWKTQLLDRAGVVFEASRHPEAPPIDLKALHAKIGELTLENDFLEGALTKAGLLSAKR